MKNTKIALIEVKKIIDYHLKTLDEFYTCNGKSDLKSMRRIIKGLDIGCECNPYNGFNCGCIRRNRIKNNSLGEINKLL